MLELRLRRLLLAGVVSAGALMGLAGATASASKLSNATCTGTLSAPGAIAPGTYGHLSLPAGSVCIVPGTVTVYSPVDEGSGAILVVIPTGGVRIFGGLRVGPNAAFAAPQNSSPVNIAGAVTVGHGGGLFIGTETPYGPLVNTISGPVQGAEPTAIQIHNARILGSVTSTGGGADNPILDEFSHAPFPLNFNDLEDNQIYGPVTETGYQGIWGGVLRNKIFGAMTFSNNAQATPDEWDIGSNRIFGSTTCQNNTPAPNLGHSAGAPSIVFGPTLGNQAATCTGVPGGISGPPV
jgi:hypothetical protein